MLTRRLVALAFVFALGVTVIVTVLFARWEWTWSDDYVIKFGSLASIFTVGTFALAIVAGIIAMAAYIASIQPPDLAVFLEVQGTGLVDTEVYEDERRVRLLMDPRPLDRGERARIWAPRELAIRIANRNRFPARNVACIVPMGNFGTPTIQARPEEAWSGVEMDYGCWAQVQWDGGANYAIHGQISRNIHLLLHEGVIFWLEMQHFLRIDVVADGIWMHKDYDVEFLSPADFARRDASRAEVVPEELRGLEAPRRSSTT